MGAPSLSTMGGACAENTDVTYDETWADLRYFLSTHQTAFETSLLTAFKAELLIEQVSYKQRCDVYNYIHGYEDRRNTAPRQKPENPLEVRVSPSGTLWYVSCNMINLYQLRGRSNVQFFWGANLTPKAGGRILEKVGKSSLA